MHLQTIINYDHSKNLHTLQGPEVALPLLLEGRQVSSLLDVGCGNGTWLRAAQSIGIQKLVGIDGVVLSTAQLHVAPDLILHKDLSLPFDLGCQYDVVISLEVAEHLPKESAPEFIRSLTRHGDFVIFSAASPDQPGQNHIHCQWPAYWQGLFNHHGFVCDDSVRWKLWNLSDVEPWYKQNVFVAQKNLDLAGKEQRLNPVIHPGVAAMIQHQSGQDTIARIEAGCMPVGWYFDVLVSSLKAKFSRKVSKPSH